MYRIFTQVFSEDLGIWIIDPSQVEGWGWLRMDMPPLLFSLYVNAVVTLQYSMQMAWLSCVHRAVVAGQSSGEFPQRD
jgi:hypothetical protein